LKGDEEAGLKRFEARSGLDVTKEGHAVFGGWLPVCPRIFGKT
jgi:hypothetical protein